MKYEFTNKSKKASWLLSVALLIFIDQLSKYIIRFYQSAGSGFYICNTGIAFGLHLPSWLILIIAIAFLFIISLLIFNFKSRVLGTIPKIALCLILAGAVSNIIDRLSFGCVIDFINIKIWPIFNFADIFICTGVFVLILKNKT